MLERSARTDFEQRTGAYSDARFGQVITAMVTPFKRDKFQSVDYDRAQELARYLVDNGSDGLVLAGTTGESPVLKFKEERDLFLAVRQAVDVPILAGTGSNDTAVAKKMTRQVTKDGTADGFLVVSPYYNRPPQTGIDHYFREVAGATDLDIMMYNIPGRTGRRIATKTMIALAHEVPNIVALKDAGGDPSATRHTMDQMPDGFEWYSGDDDKTLTMIGLGAVGTVSVASHWAGVEIGTMIDHKKAGRHYDAGMQDRILKKSYDFETGDEYPNPIPTKVMLNHVIGIEVGECRPPLVAPISEQQIENAHSVYRQLLNAA